jgi:hypothetical protein
MQCYVYFAGRGVKATTALLKDHDADWRGAHFGDARGCPVSVGTYDTYRAYCNRTVEHERQEGWDKQLVAGTVPFEYGVYDSGKSGVKKKTLEDCRAVVTKGTSLKGLIESGDIPLDMISRNYAFIKDLTAMYAPKRDLEKVRVILLIGPPHTGKTWYVKEHFPDAYFFKLNNGASATWCSAELGEAKVVVLNDFYGQGIEPSTTLEIFSGDPASFRMPGGAEVNILADTIIVTSNSEPREWYPGVKEKNPTKWQRGYDAFMSRCAVPSR